MYGEQCMDNGKVEIRVLDLLGSKEFVVDVPVSADISRLIPVLISRTSLPLTSSDGQKINYRLFRTKTNILLAGDDTLLALKVEENEVFICVPETRTVDALGATPVSKKIDSKLEENISITTAPIIFPRREDLAVTLVKGDVLLALENYRSDEMRFSAIMWMFVGAALGIIVNWVTSIPVNISPSSIVALLLFLIMAGINGVQTVICKRRTDKVNAEIALSTINARPSVRN
jgi:hypothetical protein